MGMTLSELYQRMDGDEIDERIALNILQNPETREKLKAEYEIENINNMSPEEQADFVVSMLTAKKK